MENNTQNSVKEISKIKLPDNTVFNIKDEALREAIKKLMGEPPKTE